MVVSCLLLKQIVYLVVMMLIQMDPLEQLFNYLNTDAITRH